MQLVLFDEQRQLIVARYGEFTPELAEAFFAEALSAMQFQREFPEAVVQNEIHLLKLAGTLSRMGLLQGDPDAIQQWMRPYIENELVRREKHTGLLARAARKVGFYSAERWSSFWAFLFAKVTGWVADRLGRKNVFTLLLLLLPSNFS